MHAFRASGYSDLVSPSLPGLQRQKLWLGVGLGISFGGRAYSVLEMLTKWL